MADSPWILNGAAFLIGLCFGSFGNVVVARVPVGRSILGRSRCPACGAVIAAYDLIPVLSFRLLRGRCRSCRAPIRARYPLLEIAVGLIFLLAFSVERGSIALVLLLAFALSALLLMAVVDAQIGGIPDALTGPFLLLAVLGNLLGPQTASGALAAGAFFLVQWMVSGGRWVGSADIAAAAGIGALLGSWQPAMLAVALAYVAGALWACIALLRGTAHRGSRIPFVPFLFIGTLSVILLRSVGMSPSFL